MNTNLMEIMMFSRIYLFVPNVSQKGGGGGACFCCFFRPEGGGGHHVHSPKMVFPPRFSPCRGGGGRHILIFLVDKDKKIVFPRG